ncbi:M24 family metallopeptidase [Salibacterium qingdaonense]|uniref:M24 family metallopeptidase n=1 Tax=Salibacterium qingdaonense TaxID=266892 RepID=UPI002481B812|nr:Xaa-Pro peptidase family protein [Salibacterium qingdaonense]
MNRIENVREQLRGLGAEAIVIDSPANRRYVSGFTGTAGAVLITQKKAYFITDFRYIEQAEAQCPGFEVVRHTSSVYEKMGELLKNEQADTLVFEKDNVSYAGYESLQQNTDAELKPLSGLLEEIRLIKSQDELNVLQQAVDIADRAFEHITSYIKPGVKEIDVSNELEFFMRREGAVSSSFDIIAASGTRSALPHGTASEKAIQSGELLTLDFGAYFQGYCSDITRTVAVGEPPSRLREIYQVVYESQLKALEEIKPGMTGAEADAVARDHIVKQGFGEYFGHGLGHGLGLEVHEGPRLSPKSSQVLEPGMVVTVEPGVYVPEIGGTRIEDDIVMTEDGNKTLSKSPKELMILGQ